MTTTRILLASLLLAAALPAPARAARTGGLRVEVLVDGRPLAEHRARGTTYVEAVPHREYTLRVTNLEPVRVAVAVAVDGRNVIDARRTSARAARKWVLEPWQAIELEGWQVDDATAHRFVFTTERDSYAAWLGDVSQAGVIEAVAFRERRRDPIPMTGPLASSRDRAGAPAPAAPEPPSERSADKARRGEAQAEAADASDHAATGFGRGVRHDVVRVPFEAEASPSASVRLRYAWRDELVELGVLPRPRHDDPIDRREHASGFTDYCPTPPWR